MKGQMDSDIDQNSPTDKLPADPIISSNSKKSQGATSLRELRKPLAKGNAGCNAVYDIQQDADQIIGDEDPPSHRRNEAAVCTSARGDVISDSDTSAAAATPSGLEAETGGGNAEDEAEGAEDDNAVPTVQADPLPQTRGARQRRPKLDAGFFCPALAARPKFGDVDSGIAECHDDDEADCSKDASDKFWNFFLDVVVNFPTLYEQMEAEGETDVDRAGMRHLDRLLVKIRSWSQSVYPYGLSLAEFARSVEKSSVKPEFQEYRTQLIRKYKTTDWRQEAIERKRALEEAALQTRRERLGENEAAALSNPDGSEVYTNTNGFEFPRSDPLEAAAVNGNDDYSYGPGLEDDLDSNWDGMTREAPKQTKGAEHSSHEVVNITPDLQAKIAAKRNALLAQRKMHAQSGQTSRATIPPATLREKIDAKRRMLLALRKSRQPIAPTEGSAGTDSGG